MAQRRIQRLNEQLKREITSLLQREVKDPRIGFVTVTGVRAGADLTLAHVYVSIMGDAAAREQTLEGLQAAAPYLRGELGRRMRLRRVPELRFELDASLEHALRIERLLEEVAARERAPDADDTERDGH